MCLTLLFVHLSFVPHHSSSISSQSLSFFLVLKQLFFVSFFNRDFHQSINSSFSETTPVKTNKRTNGILVKRSKWSKWRILLKYQICVSKNSTLISHVSSRRDLNIVPKLCSVFPRYHSFQNVLKYFSLNSSKANYVAYKIHIYFNPHSFFMSISVICVFFIGKRFRINI